MAYTYYLRSIFEFRIENKTLIFLLSTDITTNHHRNIAYCVTFIPVSLQTEAFHRSDHIGTNALLLQC